MSWTSCMEKKIEHHYGPEVSQCVKGIEKGSLKQVAECIATVVPDTSSAAILVHLVEWSAECEI
jgi:hypothetical protein